MPHILQYVSEQYAPPPEVKMENGHMGDGYDEEPPPQSAQLMAAIITVLLQHGRLRWCSPSDDSAEHCAEAQTTNCATALFNGVPTAALLESVFTSSWQPFAFIMCKLFVRDPMLSALHRQSQAVQGAAAQLRVDEAAYSRLLHAAFAELVRERYVERCKPCDMPRVAPRVS